MTSTPITWRLDDGRQTLVLAATGDALPQVVYWGASLPADDDTETLAAAHARDITGGMLDAPPDLSICPEAARGYPGQPGLRLRGADGHVLAPRLVFDGSDQTDRDLTLHYTDPALGLHYTARITADPETHVLTLSASLESDAPVLLDWLAAPVLPGPDTGTEIIEFSGRWCGEFQEQRSPWRPGARLRDARTGRSGHEDYPGLYLPASGTANTHGNTWALHYGWSGGHRMIAEELPDGRRAVQFGHASGSHTAPGTRFETAPLYATFSANGLNGCATAFQRHTRARIVTPARHGPRPVHYNCWEAIYFDHDLAALKEIATRAAALGSERFVLDDGWFKGRNDDTTSLGDWVVDAAKYPDGLAPLIEHVKARGMAFGLWVEPEMVNEASDLCRAHPDWILGPADQPLGRGQYVLDMARLEVRDAIYDQLAALLSAYDITYLKWDHNRVLPLVDAAQTHGTYALLARLRATFSEVEIESCASGGGRTDAGILAHTQRVWLSDSNDAMERLKIQHGAALFLPGSVTGAHVGPRHCHTSGRVLDIRMRAWVAAQRHMGFEMDPRELTDEEAAVLSDVTGWWKLQRAWLMQADIHRLDSPDPAVIAEQQIAPDGARFAVFAGRLDTSAQVSPRPLPLTALDPAARYRVTLVNRADAGKLSKGAPLLRDRPLDASGAWLMEHGVALPWSGPGTMWVLEGERL